MYRALNSTSYPAPGLRPTELVRLVQVSKRIGMGAASPPVLQDVDLLVSEGETVTIYGASGEGKTTLMNLIGMFDTASDGSIAIARLLVAKLSERARAALRGELIGFVFQADALVPVLSARDNVLLPLSLRARPHGGADADARARAAELLGQLGLAGQADQLAGRLDASARQRVAIARALITCPRLVLADEPSTRLDDSALRLVMQLFARQQHLHGTAFILTTCDQRQPARQVRALHLSDGRLRDASTLLRAATRRGWR